MFRPDRALEVRAPSIPHRPRGLQAPHNAAAPVSPGWPAFLCAPSWPIGHEAQGNQSVARPTTRDGCRRSVWLLRATATFFFCSLADFKCSDLYFCVCAGARGHLFFPAGCWHAQGEARFLLDDKRGHRSHVASCLIPKREPEGPAAPWRCHGAARGTDRKF